MESYDAPPAGSMSRPSPQVLGDGFAVEPRAGAFEVKGKGLIETYYYREANA